MSMGHVRISEKGESPRTTRTEVVLLVVEMGHVRISENGKFLNPIWWKWGMFGFQKQVNVNVCFDGNAAHRISEEGEYPHLF